MARSGFYLLLFLTVLATAPGQKPEKRPPVPGPMLEAGTVELDTPELSLRLVRSSQTVAALAAKAPERFDFSPGDLLTERSQDGYVHLGDLDLRLRSGRDPGWRGYSTALKRAPVLPLPASGEVLAEADLAPTLPQDFPLRVTRAWLVDGGKLVLRFTLENRSPEAVEIGALGIPMVFNNILNDRSLPQAHERCVFYDPYIGEDAGYLQVTRLNGHGPALAVVPERGTPFEAYNPILSNQRSETTPALFHDLTPRGITFEGFYEWMAHSKAYAEEEWKGADPWNPPTSVQLAPGALRSYGVRFLLSDSIRHIEKTLAENRRPVAVGIPGYVLPTDTEGKLFVKYPAAVTAVTSEPHGGIAVESRGPVAAGWKLFALRGKSWGRVRLKLVYADGAVQSVHYFVMKPASQAVSDFGRFLTTKQWFEDPNDPFHRSPSVMSYDRETERVVLQDSRAWIAGLGDEGGAGSWLAAAMKEFVQPDRGELQKYERFVDGVLWGGLQHKDGPHRYGVRKSLFYYQPDQMPSGYYRKDFDWTSWTSWNKEASEKIDRSYDYPHVAAAYWALYRLARNHQGLVANHPWDWYLSQAYHTSLAMTEPAVGYSEFGQMEGDIFVLVLEDLKREGKTAEAAALEAQMRARAERWRAEPYPFGSEMPWDSTGQEEVYAWMKYFGYAEKADVTLNAILGYDPTVPHWGYNGSARRYWDFIFAGKERRIERQLHHYGSGINAIPLLAEYREHPGDFYLLRVGYGGVMGSLTNIDQQGFASAAFHAFPDMLRFDPYSADYGPNFFGHAILTAAYLVRHPEFGWLSFGGNVREAGDRVIIEPTDSFRSRIYVAPRGLWLTLDAGRFEKLELNAKTGAVRVALGPKEAFTPTALLRIEEPARPAAQGEVAPAGSFPLERGAYRIPLKDQPVWLQLVSKKR